MTKIKLALTYIITVTLMIIISAIPWIAIIAGDSADSAKSETYPLNTIVQEVNKETDTVTCIDYNGNLWEFYGVKDWQEGDFATMIMDTCGTTNIFDDEIIKVEYNGNVEGLK